MAPIRNLMAANWEAAACSAFLFLLDRFTDDVGDVGVTFFFFLDEGRVVEALIHLDFFFLAGVRCAFSRRGLLALLFGLGILERYEFGVGGLRHDALGRCHGRGLDRRRGFGPRARRCRRRDRYNLAGVR